VVVSSPLAGLTGTSEDRILLGINSPLQMLAQAVQSAAHSAGCPTAVFYLAVPKGFTIGASFGIEKPSSTNAGREFLARAAELSGDGLLIINDVESQPGFIPSDAFMFGADMAPVHFIAAARVSGLDDKPLGILVVTDISPHAGLSPAEMYVLKAHAAQLSLMMELHSLRLDANKKNLDAFQHSSTERLRLLESVVVNANDAVLITEAEPISSPGPRIVYCNAAFTRTTGYTEAEILGLTPRILQSPETNREALAKLKFALSRWKPVEIELLNQRKDGVKFWVELSIVPVANEKGWFTHWVSVQRDVSDRKIAEETATRARIFEAENLILEADIKDRKRIQAELLYTAFHDELTKLRNRAFFMDRLAETLGRMKSDANRRCAVLFMDLDRFKLVNDSLGHRSGDLLLMEVAKRLRSCIRSQDTLARVGGDEFALLIEDAEGIDLVEFTTKRILEAMRQPLWLGKQEIFTSCSIGVLLASAGYESPEELLRDADIAMYQAKRHETGSYAVFQGSMHNTAVQALELRTDLQNAVARREFLLHYQPICDAATGEITGLEALVRWQHPQRGLVFPNDFIKISEETGLIREIGSWVMREACAQMKAWLVRFPNLELRLSVNTSAEELKDNQFISTVREVLVATGLDPRTLQIEVTEGIFLHEPERVGKILSELRSLGIRIALDDFGTGYSSLSYIDQYQMDTIKIDRSFVIRMLTQERTMAIVETIVRLGRALQLDIVAEGVEDDMQLQALLSKGCSSVQGYLFGRPMPVTDIEQVLQEQSVRRSI
jgi:diguanylate cyclase (GGDEF)-like protein/PAS domain S-box-containing protein